MNKVAVVTGGASGIGRAVAECLAADNYMALLLDISAVNGKRVEAGIHSRGQQGRFLRLDVTRESAVLTTFQRLIAEYGHIDVLVNVAGGSLHEYQVEEFSLKHWRAVIDLNLTSTFLCCRAVAGAMKARKAGAIVNISSEFGFTGAAQRSAYAAAKAGVVAFSKSLALELAPHGVRVNTVAPGRIATERIRAHYTDAEWAAGAREIPLGRAGEPEEVARAVAFLVGDSGRYVTGQTLHINGGRF